MKKIIPLWLATTVGVVSGVVVAMPMFISPSANVSDFYILSPLPGVLFGIVTLFLWVKYIPQKRTLITWVKAILYIIVSGLSWWAGFWAAFASAIGLSSWGSSGYQVAQEPYLLIGGLVGGLILVVAMRYIYKIPFSSMTVVFLTVAALVSPVIAFSGIDSGYNEGNDTLFYSTIFLTWQTAVIVLLSVISNRESSKNERIQRPPSAGVPRPDAFT